nr:uncharacterized protein LOC117684209 [Crassostrea gigas]
MAEFPEEDDSTVSQSQRRTNKFTVAGRAMYEENVNNRYASLSKIKRKMDSEIEYYLQSKDKEKISVLVKENLVTLSKKYKQEAQEFIDYLRRIGTEESEKERLSFELILSTLEMRIEKTVEELNNVISTSDDLLPSDAYSESTTTKSSISSTSKRSSKKSHSSNSTIILRQRAKAEALKAKLEFTEKEIQLKRQKSKLEEEEQKRRAEVTRKSVDLETDLELLCAQKEKAIVDAELQAMVEFDVIDSQLDTDLDTIDSTEKTRKYIDDVFKYNNETTTDCEPRNQETVIPTTTTEISQAEMFPQQPKVHRKTVTELPDDSEQRHVSTEKHEHTSESSQFSQLANYILKKDLMLSRITSFDDKPEHYQTWKSSFKSVSQDLKLFT